MFLTMFKKNENIVLTMHISDVFGKKYFKQIEICNKFWKKSVFFNNLLTNTRMVTILSKHLKGHSGPRVSGVFGSHISEVIRDPASVGFLAQTSVCSFGTPREWGFWTEHPWGHLGPRVSEEKWPKMTKNGPKITQK